jgi:hypothetical protein
MRRLGRPLLLAALATAAAFAACTLNPQPLPPSDNERAQAGDNDASFGGSDSGAVTTTPEVPPPQGPVDASVGANDPDAALDGTVDGGEGGIADADTD